MRVLFCGTGWLDVVPIIRAALEAEGVAADVTIRDPARSIAEQLEGIDVALPSNLRFDRDVISRAAGLRLIQQPAAGYEGIDVTYAESRGIPVCNAPSANADAVAEATLLLLLSLARRVGVARRSFAKGSIGAPVGAELKGRHLGIVGLGRTGRRVAEVAAGIGMQVRGITRTDGRAGLLSLVKSCDAVSIHCPLDEATRGLFDDAVFARFRPGAWLVNVSRGAVVDRGALVRALDEGRLAGVGLDVFWQEPWDSSDPFFARDDVVVLPHIAGSTREAFENVARVVASNVARLARGEALLHRIAAK